MIDTRAYCKMQRLMAMFDVERERHKNCVGVIHFVRVFRESIYIGHATDLDRVNACSLMTVVKIHGAQISESQRATLRNRILKELEA